MAKVDAGLERAVPATSGCWLRSTVRRLTGARLLKRVLEIDLQHGPNYGRQLKIIAVILESAVIEGILAQQGLKARAPLRTPGTRASGGASCQIAA